MPMLHRQRTLMQAAMHGGVPASVMHGCCSAHLRLCHQHIHQVSAAHEVKQEVQVVLVLEWSDSHICTPVVA